MVFTNTNLFFPFPKWNKLLLLNIAIEYSVYLLNMAKMTDWCDPNNESGTVVGF